jgi:hypothetical protein
MNAAPPSRSGSFASSARPRFRRFDVHDNMRADHLERLRLLRRERAFLELQPVGDQLFHCREVLQDVNFVDVIRFRRDPAGVSPS